jgi:hypothetical protein
MPAHHRQSLLNARDHRCMRDGSGWVGHYRWYGGRYMWVPGRWVNPPRRGAVWIPGRWVPRGGGYVYIAGSWR